MSWHVDGELTGQGLDRPYFSTHVSSGTDSLLAVTDTMNHRIVLFRGLGGEVVRILGEGALRCPMGIVAHPKDRMVVYVVDMGSTRLLKMSLLDGRVMASVGSHGTGPGELRSPQGVAVSGRLIFVCDTSNNRVCVFEDSSFMGLNFSHAFGTKGSAPGELLGPTGVAVLGERVFVTERYNHRVSVFDDDGALVRCIGGHRSSAPGFFNEPFGVALLPPAGAAGAAEAGEADGDAAGTRLLVSEYFGRRVQVLSVHGVPLQVVHDFRRITQTADSFGLGSVSVCGSAAAAGRGRFVVVEPKAGALHGVSQGADASLQERCFEALAAQCADLDDFRQLVLELRAQYVSVAMRAALPEAAAAATSAAMHDDSGVRQWPESEGSPSRVGGDGDGIVYAPLYEERPVIGHWSPDNEERI